MNSSSRIRFSRWRPEARAIGSPRLFAFFLAVLCVSVLVGTRVCPGQESGSSNREIDFNRDIRPLLSDNCFACHGPDENSREADLRLDDEASAKADRDGAPIIVPGKPDRSLLIERIFSEDPDEVMPPADHDKKLTDRQKKLLRDWVQQGAAWSKHWAYVPPKKHPVPKVDSDWPRSWIDNFILERVSRKGLQPVGDADRITLLRRVYFDLIGLPPSPQDVDAFLRDRSDDAFAKVVKKLLDSDHFGERMAIYWLDLVRYADTVGYHGDQDQSISPYRDWVIEAFNANMPFDQFTREQLAGDLLADKSVEHLIASGYNRLLQTTHEGGLQPAEYRAIYAADRVRNVSAVWMGATMGCAQCHDHKYDPYTMRDFYSMAAFFADVDDEDHFKSGTNSLPTRRNPEIRVFTKKQQAELEKLKRFRLALAQQLPENSANSQAQSEARATIQQRLAEIDRKIQKIEKQGRLTMITKALEKPRVVRILPRGNYLDQSGPVVQPAYPQFLVAAEPGTAGANGSARRLNRLDLANWLVDPDNGTGLLTARVFVNRVWYLLFGRGLAPDLGDFGGQGLPPNHPELLDNLAIQFVESGWDIKELMETLVLTRTYQLSSNPTREMRTIDPENDFFARQTRTRLPAEMIRDNALAVSGLLVTRIGGDSIRPYQPAGYYRHLNFPQRTYHHHTDQRQYQRGVYIHWQRQFLHPMLKAFDAPSREECTAQRPRSNTPTAALVLLNDPTFVESARVFAERIMLREKDPARQIELAFQIAMSRKPDDYEKESLLELYTSSLETFRRNPESAKKLLSVGLKPYEGNVELLPIAALTQVMRALFNLDEFVSRP